MYDFDYHRPKSVADAVALLKGNEEARPMSGGMTLIPTLKQRLARRPTWSISAASRNWPASRSRAATSSSARMTTHAEVAASADVKSDDPGAGRARRRHRRPAGAQPRHDRRLGRQQRSGGRLSGGRAGARRDRHHQHSARSRPTTSSTACSRPRWSAARSSPSISFPMAEKAAYVKFPNPASRYAMVGVFVAKTAAGVRVAVTGAGPCVFRVKAMEEALSKNFSSDAIKDIKVPADGSQQRHPRQRRIPRPSGRRDGPPRGRQGQQVAVRPIRH